MVGPVTVNSRSERACDLRHVNPITVNSRSERACDLRHVNPITVNIRNIAGFYLVGGLCIPDLV